MNRPSDNPVGAAKVLEVRTEKVNTEQFTSNARLAEAFLNTTDHALEDLTDILMRAKEIAINQSSSASSTPESRLGVAEEVTQLFQRAVSTANRRVGDRYVLGGYKNTEPPVGADGQYVGDAGEIMIEVGREVFIGMNIPGHEVFNTNPQLALPKAAPPAGSSEQKDEAPGAGPQRTLASTDLHTDPAMLPQAPNSNLFQELRALRIGLLTGDMDAIRSTLDSFDGLMTRMIANRAKIGARVQGIQGSITTLEKQSVTNAALTSQIEDADLTQVVSDLAKEESVFKSSLASSKHLIQPTLLDFLR